VTLETLRLARLEGAEGAFWPSEDVLVIRELRYLLSAKGCPGFVATDVTRAPLADDATMKRVVGGCHSVAVDGNREHPGPTHPDPKPS
jgi:hypothetical protein